MKLVIQAFQGQLALKDTRVIRVQLDNRVDKEKLVNKVRLDNRGNMEDMAQLVNKVKLDIRELVV